MDRRDRVLNPIQGGTAFEYVSMDQYDVVVVDPKTKERFFIDKTGREYRKFSH